MKYKHGNKCTQEKNYGLDLQINCDPLAKESQYEIDPDSISKDECHPKVILTSAAGCPSFSMPPLWRWNYANHIIIGIFLVLIGGLLLQFGPQYDKECLIMISTMSISTIVLVFLHALIMPSSTPQWMVWITLFMSIGIGAGAGYSVYAWPKSGIIYIGLTLGTIFGVLIYLIFMSNITGNLELELGISSGSSESVTLGGIKRNFADIETEEWRQLILSVFFCQLLFAAVSIVFYQEALVVGT